MNYTKDLVAIFIVLLITAGMREYAKAEPVGNGLRIALGHTLFNKSETHGEFGYHHNRWEAAYSFQGAGGFNQTTEIYSLSRLVRPGWDAGYVSSYFRIGGAYVRNSDLVGDVNFRLGVGADYKVFGIEFFHYSSAGIYDTNRGIDGVMIRYNVPIYN